MRRAAVVHTWYSAAGLFAGLSVLGTAVVYYEA